MLTSLSGLSLCAGLGWAGTVQQTWSARATGEYVTNPLLNPADQSLSAWRSTINPGYLLTDTLGDDMLNAGLDIMIVKSSNTGLIANRNNPTATVGWRHTGEKGEFGISTSYKRSSTMVTESSATGLVSANSVRTSRDLSADWIRELSQRATLTLNGAYTEINYSADGGGTNLSDYSSQSSGTKLNYEWDEHTAIFLNLSYVNLLPADTAPGSRQYNARLGMDWNASDRFNYALQAGPSRLESMGVSVTSMQGGVAMNYKGQESIFNLSANRQSMPSGLGAIIVADQMNGNLSYDLGERNKTGLDIGWRKSDYLTGNTYRTAGVWLRRELNPFWEIKAYLNHNTNFWGGQNQATSNIFGLSAAYTKF